MGISGRIAKIFLHSQMTPLLALVAVLLGIFAVMVTPREEEPQINVTMANVLIAYPGASAQDVANTVATPAEQTNESYRSDTDGETRTRPIINWPTIDIPFDQASPQTTSTFRTRLQFDPQHEGDAVEVTLSSHSAGIVDPLSGKVCDLPAASSVTLPTAVTTAWVTNPPPAPVRSAITKTIAFGPTDSCRGSGRTA